MIEKARNAARWIRAHWKIVLGGLTGLLAVVYAYLSQRHRAARVSLEKRARDAGRGKVQDVAAAGALQKEADRRGDKANQYQRKATEQVEKMKAKGKPRMADAIELTEQINGRGE